MFCNKCGKEVADGVQFCPACGNAMQNQQSAPNAQQTVVIVQQQTTPPKSRTAYILLAFFLGTLGIHNFYAGRTACGVVQLLITILSCGFLSWISGLWALIEMFTVSRDGYGVPMQGGGVLLAVILVIVWLILAILALGLLPALNSAREQARIISCNSNLKQIGLGLMQYAVDFDNRFPPQDNADGLELLRSTGVLTDHTVYVCPSSTTTAGSGEEPLTDLNCDYVYLGGLALYHDWSKDCPVAFERPGSHSKDRINILYGDGRVNTVRLPDSVLTVTDLLEYLAGQADNLGVQAFLQKKQLTAY